MQSEFKELQNNYNVLTEEKSNLEVSQTKLQERNQQLSQKLSEVSVEHEQVSKKSQGVTHELKMLQDQMNSKVVLYLFTYVNFNLSFLIKTTHHFVYKI